MIITRTPLRISLGGGGTDLPSYYRTAGDGGFLVAAAVTKYVYVAVNRNFDDDLLLKYSKSERAADPEQVEHPLLRECLRATGVTSGVEISSMADVPAGTGLGSSGAFTVGVLRALMRHRDRTVDNRELAALACEIEIDRLDGAVGKQDPYISALGGVTALTFRPDEAVDARAVDIPTAARGELEQNLLLFFTGLRRSASDELRGQATIDEGGRDNLDAVRAIGEQSERALEAGDLACFADLMTRQWELKHARSPGPVHDRVDAWIRRGLESGAQGGKLVGAGGGGFLLFSAEDPERLRAAMTEVGLEELDFGIDDVGATTIVG